MVPLCWSSAIRANARIPRLSPTRTRGRRCKSAARHWSTPIDSAHSMVIHNTGVLNGPDVLAVNTVAPFVLTAIMRKPRRLIYPTRWTRRLRRWPPRRRRSPRGAGLLRRPPAPGPAPVHRFLPELIDLIWTRQIDPGTCSTSNCPRPSRRRRHGDGRAQGHQGPAPPLTSTPRPGSSPAPDGAPASTSRKPPLSPLVTSCMCRVAGDSCPQLRRGARGRVTCSDAVEHLRRVGMAQAPSPPALRAGSGSVWRSPSRRVGPSSCRDDSRAIAAVQDLTAVQRLNNGSFNVPGTLVDYLREMWIGSTRDCHRMPAAHHTRTSDVPPARVAIGPVG